MTTGRPWPAAPVRLIRRREALMLTGLGKSQIMRMEAAGTFPKRVQITARAVGYVESEVHAWITARIAARGAD